MMSSAPQPNSAAAPMQYTPAIVDARCRTPAEVAVWRAVDRLLQSGRTSIGSRELAAAAGVSRRALSARRCPRTGALLPGILERLVQLGLLQIVGSQRVGNFPQPRPIFAIDYAALAAASGGQGSAPVPAAAPHPAAPVPAAAPASHADRAAGYAPAHGATHGALLPHDGAPLHHAARRNLEPVHGAALHQIQRERETEREMPAPTSQLHLMPVPSDAYPLPADPHTLWRDLHPTPRSIDLRLLDAFAAEHDAHTGGCGAYWVGRAILALALTHDAPPIRLLKAVLDRWRNEGSYGSDAATYRQGGSAQGGQPLYTSHAQTDVQQAAQATSAELAASGASGASGASVAVSAELAASGASGASGASVAVSAELAASGASGASGASVAADASPAPVAHYTRRTGVQLTREQAAHIAATVRDMAAWDAVLSDWLANGWRLTSIGNMLDAYAKRATRNAPPVSDTPIVLAADLDPSERERWLARFRAAPPPERAQVLAAFHAARAG